MKGLNDRLAELRAGFVVRSREDRQTLIRSRREGDLATMRRVAHSLAGNGGIFGFPEISEVARQLETALEAGQVPDAICKGLEARLAALEQP